VLIAELKARDSNRTAFNNTDIGEIITNTLRLLNAQMSRTYVYSFLADTEMIQFFCVHAIDRTMAEYSYYKTHVYKFGGIGLPEETQGKNHLLSLLSATLSQLGFEELTFQINNLQIVASGFLGEGLTSRVYKANYRQEDVAIKHFKQEYISHLQKETSSIDILCKNNIVGIPTIKFIGQNFFVMTPVGSKIQQFTKATVTQALQILKTIHNIGIVHRDVRLNNFILYNQKLFLIDWSFATSFAAPDPYRGTLYYASNAILQSHPNVVPTPQDDLHALVRVVFIHMFPHLKPALYCIESSNLSEIKLFWQKYMPQGSIWHSLDNLCDGLSYDLINEIYLQFLPE